MPRQIRAFAQLRARTPLQRALTLAVVIIEVAGITAIATGHRDLGRTLIGLGIVLTALMMLWMRKTNLPK